MKSKGLITIIAVFVGIFCLVGFTFAAEEEAEKIKVISKVVTLKADEGASPPVLTSKVGTTVIWMNRDSSPVEILFLDKKVVLACGSPVNFFIGKDGAYESAKIPFGGTASLCFTEKGKYDYIFKGSKTFRVGTIEREPRGSIVIK